MNKNKNKTIDTKIDIEDRIVENKNQRKWICDLLEG